MAKYGLSIYELRRASSRGGANAPPWEAKSMWLFYIELLTGKWSSFALLAY
jgi:E3 ubiquitin-protein ligase synoviolin